jgi:hypothetical protein
MWRRIGATGFVIVMLLPGIAIRQFSFPFSEKAYEIPVSAISILVVYGLSKAQLLLDIKICHNVHACL